MFIIYCTASNYISFFMFIEALFVKANKWKQPKSPKPEKWQIHF